MSLNRKVEGRGLLSLMGPGWTLWAVRANWVPWMDAVWRWMWNISYCLLSFFATRLYVGDATTGIEEVAFSPDTAVSFVLRVFIWSVISLAFRLRPFCSFHVVAWCLDVGTFGDLGGLRFGNWRICSSEDREFGNSEISKFENSENIFAGNESLKMEKFDRLADREFGNLVNPAN